MTGWGAMVNRRVNDTSFRHFRRLGFFFGSNGAVYC